MKSTSWRLSEREIAHLAFAMGYVAENHHYANRSGERCCIIPGNVYGFEPMSRDELMLLFKRLDEAARSNLRSESTNL